MATTERIRLRKRRKRHTRRQLSKTERTQLTVYRSSKHIYALLVDSLSGKTITAVSTRTPSLAAELEAVKGSEAAKKVGKAIAKLAQERQIREVSFNRNGFVYAGRIKALADAAREAGLKF